MIYRQKGLSLIELLVALALSSILILGITQVFIDNKRNQVFQASQIGNLENARFAELLLNNHIRRAGYRRAPDTLIEEIFPRRSSDTHCDEFEAGDVVTTASQGFCLRYQPLENNEFDCAGEPAAVFDDTHAFTVPPTDQMVVLAIKYEPGTDASRLDQGTLQCRNINNASSIFVELVSNVADFSTQFGYGPDDIMDKRIEHFGTSGSGTIRAVQFSILLASQPNQRDTVNSPTLQRWLDEINPDERLTAGDNRRIYQIAQSTQIIRNYMP